jgi:cold shock CspA family protein
VVVQDSIEVLGGLYARGYYWTSGIGSRSGFIRRIDGADLFFHGSDLQAAVFAALREGQEVGFEIDRGRDGRLQAVKGRLAMSQANVIALGACQTSGTYRTRWRCSRGYQGQKERQEAEEAGAGEEGTEPKGCE